MGYPKDIEKFHNTMLRLRGISGIESGVDNLEPIDLELLSAPESSHLPHGAILRTKGGLKNEILLQFEFTMDYSLEGLQSLEFIAWFIRDCARGGTKIQLRPFALPPVTPNGRQLGSTLKFHIDLFVDNIEDSLEPAFKAIQHLDKSLNLYIDMYNIPVKD